MSEKSLCWGCYRADHFLHDGFYCPWAANFVPVNGWSAIPSRIVSAEIDEIIDSFEVVECPLFTAEKKKERRGK